MLIKEESQCAAFTTIAFLTSIISSNDVFRELDDLSRCALPIEDIHLFF